MKQTAGLEGLLNTLDSKIEEKFREFAQKNAVKHQKFMVLYFLENYINVDVIRCIFCSNRRRILNIVMNR